MKHLLLIIGIMVSFLLQSEPGYCQTYSVVQGNILIIGTSNGHSWGLESRKMECKADIVFSGDRMTKFRSLMFAVKVKDLKGNNIWMNRGVYKALRGYPFDQVNYQGVYFTVSNTGENIYEVKSEGNLIIGGVTQVTTISINTAVNPDGSLTCTGSKAIKMSDFNVHLNESETKRMNVGNEVILTFQIKMAPDKEL